MAADADTDADADAEGRKKVRALPGGSRVCVYVRGTELSENGQIDRITCQICFGKKRKNWMIERDTGDKEAFGLRLIDTFLIQSNLDIVLFSICIWK